MSNKSYKIAAGEFKAKCLNLMDQVDEQRIAITITKHGVPVAKLVPIEKESFDIFGCLKNNLTINADIIEPIDEQWDADQ
jgi:prevent-host-death family protein